MITRAKELNSEHIVIEVKEQATIDLYFDFDNEVCGWVISLENDQFNISYLYRRAHNPKTGVMVEEPVIFNNNFLKGEEFWDNVNLLLAELKYIAEESGNNEILEKVENKIGSHLFLSELYTK